MLYNHGGKQSHVKRYFFNFISKNIHGKPSFFRQGQNYVLHKNRKKVKTVFLGPIPTRNCDPS